MSVREGKADLVAKRADVWNDPNVWSSRALQEGFVNLADAVLHQCIRPLIGVCCAPGHHGYQRAFELTSFCRETH